MASYFDYDNKDKKLYEEVDKLKNGDSMAYDTVYKLSQKYIYKLIMDIVNDFSVTESIMQDVYNQVYNRIATLRNSKTFYVWAGRIATDLTLTYIKSNKPEMLDADLATCIDDGSFVVNRAYEDTEDFIPEGVVTDTNKLNFIAGVLDEMSVGQKITVQYFYYQEMSVAEIMDKMGCTVDVVKARLILAKNLIKRALGEAGVNMGTRMYNLGTVPIFWLVFRNAYESLIFETEEDDSEKTSMLYDGLGMSRGGVAPGYGAMGGSGAMGSSDMVPQKQAVFAEQNTIPMANSMINTVNTPVQAPSVSNDEKKGGKKGLLICLILLLVIIGGVAVGLIIKSIGKDSDNDGGDKDDVATVLDATPTDEMTEENANENSDETSDVNSEEELEEVIEEVIEEIDDEIITTEEGTDDIFDIKPQDPTPTDASESDNEDTSSGGVSSR